MKSDDIARAKTIILSLVSGAPGATYHMIMDRCLESLYMDFFAFSQCLQDLVGANMIERCAYSDGTGNTTADSNEDLLYITAGGKAILEDIKVILPQAAQNYVAESCEILNAQIGDRNRIRAEVRIEGDDIYAVLTVNDVDGCRFLTKIRCDDRLKAAAYCASLKKNADRILSDIEELLS